MSTGGLGFENFAGGSIAQRLVKPFVVVKQHPLADAAARLGDRDVGVDEYLFVLQAAPQTFDKDVVQITASSVHADLNTMLLQRANELVAGELRALVGVENFRLSVTFQRLGQGLHAEFGLHADRQASGQHTAAEPVHDCNQIDEAARHRNVGDVGAPHLVRPIKGLSRTWGYEELQ
jgi:hypothetical protein